MTAMRTPKHLPLGAWPAADHEAFRIAYEPGDIFDETTGPGAHLAEGTRRLIQTAYRRWLGFLQAHHPADLSMPPAARITPERVRAFIEHLRAETGSVSLVMTIHGLMAAARLIAPTTDWAWLRAVRSRLTSIATPEDRFDRLVPPVLTLDFGIELMDAALMLPGTARKQREIQYRDGLLLALVSLWPLRRCSLCALTVSRHLEIDDSDVNILLYPCDTKAKRAESFRVPEELLPYLLHYLREVRPVLLGGHEHDGFWASHRGRPLVGGSLYDMARARVFKRFGKAMSLHDFRRAASTFMAIDAPEKIGLISGVLQHASPDTKDCYNLARMMQAGQRYARHLAETRNRLRPFFRKDKQ